MSIVIANELNKKFGSLEAVKNVSLEVRPGECYGLLGPNGAGKTTILSMIRCISPASGGHLKVFGLDVRRNQRQIRHQLGVVPQLDNLDPDLTVFDNLAVYAGYFGIKPNEARQRAEQLLQFLSLDKKRSVRINQLSGGLRRRLLIARGLINNPSMLILDEPTTGLDPQARHHIWLALRTLLSQGTTMILSTHYMDEAELLCDRLSIIDHGILKATDTPATLIATHAGGEVLELFDLTDRDTSRADELCSHPGFQKLRIEKHHHTISCFSPPNTSLPNELLERVRDYHMHHTIRKASLEDVFLNLTGRDLRE